MAPAGKPSVSEFNSRLLRGKYDLRVFRMCYLGFASSRFSDPAFLRSRGNTRRGKLSGFPDSRFKDIETIPDKPRSPVPQIDAPPLEQPMIWEVSNLFAGRVVFQPTWHRCGISISRLPDLPVLAFWSPMESPRQSQFSVSRNPLLKR